MGTAIRPSCAALLALLLVISGCGSIARTVTGSGALVEERRELPSFDSLEIGSEFEAEVRLGDTPGVVFTVDDNLVDHLVVEQDAERVALSVSDDIRVRDATLRADVTVTRLNAIRARDAAKVVLDDTLIGNHLTVRTSGSSTLTGSARGTRVTATSSGTSVLSLESDADLLDVTTSGSSQAEVIGRASTLTVAGSGSSRSELASLDAKTAQVQLSGSSTSSVDVTQSLATTLSGTSELRYRGAPTITKNLSGSAELLPVDG